MATSHEVKKCKTILHEIDQHIPFRYVNEVRAIFEKKGLESPSRYRVQNVRHGKTYDLGIMKALQAISQPHDENDERIDPPKFELGAAPELDFEPEEKVEA